MHIKVGDVVDWGNHRNLVVAELHYPGYKGNDGKMHCVDHVLLRAPHCSFGTYCSPERSTEIKLSSERRASKTPRPLKVKDRLVYVGSGEFLGRGCEIVSVNDSGWQARTYYKKVSYEHAVWTDVGNPDKYEHDDGSPILRESYERPTDRKLQRQAGAMVCLTCGGFSSAQTCSKCVSADVKYVQQKIFTALKVPKEYLSSKENPLTVEEDFYIPVKSCGRCGFEACACDALGYTDEPKVDCTLSHLAQALFDTDPEVLAFVEHVSGGAHAKDPSAARKRALDIAWERDERGWATRASERAAAVKGVL